MRSLMLSLAAVGLSACSATQLTTASGDITRETLFHTVLDALSKPNVPVAVVPPVVVASETPDELTAKP